MRAVVALVLTCTAAARAGELPIGVTTVPFEKTSVTTHEPRPLPTVVWYPAARGTGEPEELGRRDARVRKGRHPLVLYSHGACGSPTEATYLTRALASRGFVVAAMPHPGHTQADFPSCLGNVADTFLNRLPDILFVLDGMLAENVNPASRFARRLRMDRVVMAGGSFGGFTTLFAAQQEPRIGTALVLVPGGTAFLGPTDVTQPTMIIGCERDKVVGWPESEMAYERLAGPRFLVEILGGNHLSVFDSCFNQPLQHSFCVDEDIPQEAAHRLVLRFAVPFLLRYANGVRSSARALRRQADGTVYRSEP